MVAILAIIICIGMIYETTQTVNEAVNYIENDFPEFSYQDGILDVKSETPITMENEQLGTIVINTNIENQEIEEDKDEILVLKDKVVVKNSSIVGTTSYKYEQILSEMGITRFEKQDVINYARGTQMISLYMSLAITLFIYIFVIYFVNTFANNLFISLFGYLANLITKCKIRYVAILNMSIYAVTLSTLLNAIYVIINMFVDFKMQYFDVMYISVAVIYLLAAIFMIRIDLQKRQTELMKIQEVQEEVKKEIQEKEKEEQDEKPKEKEEKKEQKKDKKKEEDKSGAEPEGTGA